MTEENKTLSLPDNISLPLVNTTSGQMLMDAQYFERLQRVAAMLKQSNFVPRSYQNTSDCALAVHLAYNAGIDPLFVLQNTQVVHGIPSWRGQAVIALINASKRYKKDLSFAFEKDKDGKILSCTAKTINEDGEEKSATVSWDMVQAEGWDKDKGGMKSKWNTMPEQMFCYRSATFFARRHCPDILLGMATEAEPLDMVDVTPKDIGKTEKADALNAMATDAPSDDEWFVNKENNNE